MNNVSKHIRVESEAAQHARMVHNAEVANESRFALKGACRYQTRSGKGVIWHRLTGHCWHMRQTEGPLQQECCRCPALRMAPKRERGTNA